MMQGSGEPFGVVALVDSKVSTCRTEQATAVVTDIQRFSVHDGPGIRATVFLKGCNLRCAWCHNPETIAPGRELQVTPDRCIECLACVDACDHGGQAVTEDGRHVFRRDGCIVCGECVEACFAGALALVGREMTAEEAAGEVLADLPFYRRSGGGVTISGGESLMQRDFVLDLVARCCAAGVHTAIESNMAWPWAHVEPVVRAVDLVMMDIKLIDDAAHRRWTGVSNRHVLASATRLGGEDVDVIVRTPIVCGVNDDPEQVAAIARHVADLPNLLYYELLPYHPLGAGKAGGLDRGDQPRFETPDDDRMTRLADAAMAVGVDVRVAGRPVDEPPRSEGSE